MRFEIPGNIKKIKRKCEKCKTTLSIISGVIEEFTSNAIVTEEQIYCVVKCKKCGTRISLKEQPNAL